ncbi:ADP-ribosylation factor family protein [Verticillium alfalfae VaMs.102]|uniref:ADP-ribosylation factor family protein n=1 Tax=Verticillium alfalfae (strain VaMs.102 / ATCC MYA-4576 / FGSC 10136) TaxID=526221 RepID=C9SPB4_VERA1|nr:ADP-ribosylation factor family protein [Verticillium alfalfae VaMs.102]EEY20629.1 ADP-ribosylation factor family protein [Verticillium alfalfae VaMs.102]
MYHLAKSLYLLATSKEEYSVILLGLDNAGKTTFHEQVKSLFLASHPNPKLNTVPTVGQNVSTIDLPDMYLKIWDVGGQMSLRKLWQSYYASAHAIVFILDSTDLGDGHLVEDERGGFHAKPGREDAGGGGGEDEDGRLAECKAVLEDRAAPLGHGGRAGARARQQAGPRGLRRGRAYQGGARQARLRGRAGRQHPRLARPARERADGDGRPRGRRVGAVEGQVEQGVAAACDEVAGVGVGRLERAFTECGQRMERPGACRP